MWPGDLQALWLYNAAPVVGASVGAVLYTFVRAEGMRSGEV